MGKKWTASQKQQSKEIFILEDEKELASCQNPELVAMARIVKVFVDSTATQKQLEDLVAAGLIQEQAFSEWKLPGEHRVPELQPGEIVLFVPFISSGLCLPASEFLHRFLDYFGIVLSHLTPISILHLSVLVHLCEAFLGIPPSITLFRYFFQLKLQPSASNVSVIGGCGIQFRQRMQKEYFAYDLVQFV